MTQFSDLFAEMGQPALFEQLGEVVTYFARAGGEPQPLTVTVVRRSSPREGDGELVWEDSLRVSCSADANAASGYVVEPQRGDAIWRSGHGDPATVRYAFRGNLLASNAAGWTAEFERIGPQQVGFLR